MLVLAVLELGLVGGRRAVARIRGWRTAAPAAAGPGRTASSRERCSWKAGVTQAPLELWVPDQLNDPSRAWHLREAGARAQGEGGGQGRAHE